MPRSIDINLHTELQLSLLSLEGRSAVLQVVQTVAADPDLGRSIGPKNPRRYYVDIRIERELARVYYAATDDTVYVRHIDFHYLSPQ